MTFTDTSTPSTSTSTTGTRRFAHLRRAVLASAVGVALAASATVGASAAAAHPNTTAPVNTNKIYFGVDGTVSQAAQGLNVARHIYGQVGTSVPNSRMVTMGIDGYTYTDISSAAPGSAIYTNIVRWADTIKARGTFTYFDFSHEPESSDSAKFGTAPQYIAAYQHVVDIMRAENVPNVAYVWQLTAYGFIRKGDHNAINYYPGDNYVDYVAADAYNWGGCGPGTPWKDLSVVANPVLAFAQAHGKLAMLAEFGSQAGPQRAAWLNTAHQYFVANRSELVAAFYFDRPPTTAGGADCNWSLTNTADVAAFAAITKDTTNFTS